MEYDFIVGFTLFTRKGFKTMYRHFSTLERAKMFASNVNIKNNCMIYANLKYYEDKIKAKIEEIELLKKIESSAKYTHIELLQFGINQLQELLKEE